MDGFFDEQNLERLRTADMLLLEATTYVGLKGYWPVVADNPEVSPTVAADPDVADLPPPGGRPASPPTAAVDPGAARPGRPRRVSERA